MGTLPLTPAGNEGPAQHQPGLHGNPAHLPDTPTVPSSTPYTGNWLSQIGDRHTHTGDNHSFPSCWGSKRGDVLCLVLRAQNPGLCWPPVKWARFPSLKRTPAPNPSPGPEGTEAEDSHDPNSLLCGGGYTEQLRESPFPDWTPGKSRWGCWGTHPQQSRQGSRGGPAALIPRQKSPDTYTCTDTGTSLS